MPGRDPNVTSIASSFSSSPPTNPDQSSTRSRFSFSFAQRSPAQHDPASFDSRHDHTPSPAGLSQSPGPASHSGLLLSPPFLGGQSARPSSTSHPPINTLSEIIRDDTALLSDMLLPPSATSSLASSFAPSFISSPYPISARPSPSVIAPAIHEAQQTQVGLSPASPSVPVGVAGDDEDNIGSGEATPRPHSPVMGTLGGAGRSVLSMLFARHRSNSANWDPKSNSPTSPRTPSSTGAGEGQDYITFGGAGSRWGAQTPGRDGEMTLTQADVAFSNSRPPRDIEEGTPLLHAENTPSLSTALLPSYGGTSETLTPPPHVYTSSIPPPIYTRLVSKIKTQISMIPQYTSPKALGHGVSLTVQALPAVLLGLLLNILDGISYGLVIFSVGGSVFSGFGSMGVSMFFVTTIISQLVYTLGGSSFAGATSSMIIEVIPFFHIMAMEIISRVGEENPKEVIATTLVAFALSSILTGLTFLVLGLFRLGSIIGFFPRHILVGCIGGVGVFLIQTGLNVSSGLKEEEASDISWRILKIYFTDTRILSLWVPAFLLAVLLRLITQKYHHQLIFPMYFVALPIIFYVVVLIAGFDLPTLRSNGWVFDIGGSDEPWYEFYKYFSFHAIRWRALWATMPTQLALLFFNILHPPLNVPALGVSLNKDDVDLNLELVGHGVSNLLAGFIGVPSNYLAYVNTLLFYRVGGTTRYSGFLLAVATAVLLLIGTGPIAYIPVLEVGALIFVLGLDLVKEAVWDTRHRASVSEYITILGIICAMTLYDFVSGVLLGIILSSFFFVVQNSRRHSIRNSFTGATALSTVRRPSAHRKYLQAVGKQTVILRLQGYLFFGTISRVEHAIRQFLENASWTQNPIRFLVVDLGLVGGLDMSAAEAFVRVRRLLDTKGVILVFSGLDENSDVGKALQAVELWTGNVEVFANLNEALEWTENAFLRAWYTSPLRKVESGITQDRSISISGQRELPPIVLGESYVNSPRRSHLHAAGTEIMHTSVSALRNDAVERKDQPFNTIVKTFSSHTGGLDEKFISRITPFFKPVSVPEGTVLYRQGDIPDGLYLIESGVLCATYTFADHVQSVEESCVAGTLSGELSALSGEPRNATVVAQRQSVLWKLKVEDLKKMEAEYPDDARQFVQSVLKTAKNDYDVLLAALAARQ